MKNLFKIAIITAMFSCCLIANAQTDFEEICTEKIKNTSTSTVIGEDGWLFLPAELSHISKGKFYSTNAAQTSVCENPDRQDPVPAIVDFNNQLKELGIKLYFMPVPPKALIYANKVDKSVRINQNLYTHYKNFYKELTNEGVDVVDLFSVFNQSKEIASYCKQDSHWSPQGISLASDVLANKIKIEQWYKTYSGTKTSEDPILKTIKINGDLYEGASTINLQKEEIVMNTYNKSSSIDTDSPLLIIGDSHTLIFHSGGDMLAENGGLPENVASKLGINVDLIGVKGSGTSSVRIDLYRKAKTAGWLENKKVIIWCFAARDLSESQNGWRKIPVKN